MSLRSVVALLASRAPRNDKLYHYRPHAVTVLILLQASNLDYFSIFAFAITTGARLQA